MSLVTLISLILVSNLFFSQLAFAKLYVKPAKQGIVHVEIFSFAPAVVTKDFDVGNFYDFPIDVVLQSKGNISELIEIQESSFTLQSNETKNIEYTLTIKQPGIYTGGIVIEVEAEKGGASLVYQSDLAVIANRRKSMPEFYVLITLVVIIFSIVVYLKTSRFKK